MVWRIFGNCLDLVSEDVGWVEPVGQAASNPSKAPLISFYPSRGLADVERLPTENKTPDFD